MKVCPLPLPSVSRQGRIFCTSSNGEGGYLMHFIFYLFVVVVVAVLFHFLICRSDCKIECNAINFTAFFSLSLSRRSLHVMFSSFYNVKETMYGVITSYIYRFIISKRRRKRRHSAAPFFCFIASKPHWESRQLMTSLMGRRNIRLIGDAPGFFLGQRGPVCVLHPYSYHEHAWPSLSNNPGGFFC